MPRMKLRHRSRLMGACAFVLAAACGPAAPPPASPPPPVAVAAPPASTAPPRRGPSDALVAHATFPSDPELLLYADLRGLLETDLAKGLVPVILANVTSLSADQRQCLADALSGARELLVSGKGDWSLALVGVDDAAAKPTACLSVAGAKPAVLVGALDAYRADDGVVAHLPGVYVFGTEADVARAIHPPSPPTLPAALSLDDHEYLVWTARVPNVGSMRGVLVASPERFKVAVEGDLPPPLAEKVVAQIDSLKRFVASPLPPTDPPRETPAALTQLAHAMQVQRDGGHVTAAFDLAEAVVDQARDLGAALAFAAASVRKYIASAKTAEARSVVRALGHAEEAAWAKEDAAHGKAARKKLASFPPVPKSVPRGVAYKATEADWAAWSPLGFSMTDSQRYQYEIRAAKDGMSADVFARGDLNGDGKASLFKLHLTVDPKTRELTVPSSIEETDPLE